MNNGLGYTREGYRNPVPTTDLIIEYQMLKKKGIVLIERLNFPFGLAIPGGFAEWGISLEENAVNGKIKLKIIDSGSKQGIEGAKDAAVGLRDFKIDKIYTSPLIRNRETVRLILEKLGIKLEDYISICLKVLQSISSDLGL